MRLKLFILAMFAIFANIVVYAVDFTVGYLNYNVISFENMTCEVASYFSNSHIKPIYVEIPSTVEYNDKTFTVVKIGEKALSSLDLKLLQTVLISNTVVVIGNDAFNGCSLLSHVTIPNSVTSIGMRTFSSCSFLKSITIPNSVTSIGEEAFRDCSSLTAVTLSNSLMSIESGVFRGCSSLKSITIPNSVTSIGEESFSGCSSLTSVTIPNSVASIGYEAFYDCSSLTSITIPNSVTSIGDHAFFGCHPETIIIGRDYCEEIYVHPNHEIILMEDYIGSAPNFSERNLNKVISLSLTPPASPKFSNSQIMDLEVLVPTSALPFYQLSEGWKDLWNLKGGAESATDIEGVTVTDKKAETSIYNINGMKVSLTTPGSLYIKNGKKFIAK